jgi:hypothetical protein
MMLDGFSIQRIRSGRAELFARWAGHFLPKEAPEAVAKVLSWDHRWNVRT